MATVKISGKSRGSFEPIPAGDYDAAVVGIERVQSKTSEYHYWKVQFSVTEPPFVNRRLFSNYSENPKADWMLFNLADAVGAVTETHEDGTWDGGIDPELVIGSAVVISTKPNEYQGKPGNEVTGIKASEAATAQYR